MHLSPPQRLAVAYVPLAWRGAFSLLLEFDAKLSGIVAGSTESLIGQMKLAWWRDSVAAAPQRRAKGEPLIAQLNAMPDGQLEPALQKLIDAWEMMLVDGVLEKFAEARGNAIFSSYATWVSSTVDVEELGARWATDSVGHAALSPLPPLPADRKLRPLTILALSVREVSGPRLLWHALTGR